MNSWFVKHLMELSGETWEVIIDQQNELRKKHLADGGEIIFDQTGEEIWIDQETRKELAKFELSHITDPRKMN